MNLLFRLFPWKRVLYVSLTILSMVIVLNFYGLYTNKFYFFKYDNYIVPLLTLIHFTYLYVLDFKIREKELPDPQMRNLEYVLYVILFIYLFKIFDTLYIISSYDEYDSHLLPTTFIPVGVLIVALYLFLLLMAFISFKLRVKEVGKYNFVDYNSNIDSW
tara:strand:- start:27795 stop:28274 length:480 start_codon:yes stop_codon:yes gene_type:complete